MIVEGFFDCMKLHQFGYRKTVALMGYCGSGPAQLALAILADHLSNDRQALEHNALMV